MQVYISGSERFHGGVLGKPLQYSCRESSVDREDWCATVQSVAELDMIEVTLNAQVLRHLSLGWCSEMLTTLPSAFLGLV